MRAKATRVLRTLLARRGREGRLEKYQTLDPLLDCTRPGAKTLMLPQWGQPAARCPPWEQKAHCTLLRDPSGWREENWGHVRLAVFKISQAASAWWAAARRPTTKERGRKL